MSGPSERIRGFASNLSSSMIRNSARNPRITVDAAESVWSSDWSENQLNKLDRSSGPNEGRLNNRKLDEPPRSALALCQAKNNWTQIGKLISVCLASLRIHKSVAYSTGIVFGDRGKHGISSCRGGAKLHVLSLKHGISKKPPLCTILQDVIIWVMVDVPVQGVTATEGS